MVRVPLFEVGGWECSWEPRRGHTFARGLERIRVRSNGAWKPGMAPVKHGEHLPARFMQVDRGLFALARTAVLGPRRMRGFGENTSSTGVRELKGWGNVTDGGEQGGGGFSLHPRWRRSALQELDGTIERHPVAAFHWDTGRPLTRADLGHSDDYVLDACGLNDGQPFQLDPFVNPWTDHPLKDWRRIDVFHYARAFDAAVAAWNARRDVVAFFWLICLAQEALRWLPLLPVTNGDSLYQRLRNLETPQFGHKGKLGVVRGRAHALRVVVEAARALQGLEPNVSQAQMRRDLEGWIRSAIDAEFLSQMLNGSYTNNTEDEPSSEQGQPWHVAQPLAYRADGSPDFTKGTFRVLSVREGEAPSWQLCFLTVALAEASKVVPDKLDRVRSLLRGHKSIFDTCQRVPDRYRPELRGLPYWLVVSRDGAAIPIIEGIGLADTTYDADAFRAFAEVGL